MTVDCASSGLPSDIMAKAGKSFKAKDEPKPVPQPAYHYEPGGVPVFTPTMAEFRDFRAFVSSIDEFGAKHGIVKVIPPKEWKDSLPPISVEKLRSIKIHSAIRQEFVGLNGRYTQVNIPYRKKMNLKEWRDLCYTEEYMTPSCYDRNVPVFNIPVEEKEVEVVVSEVIEAAEQSIEPGIEPGDLSRIVWTF